MAEFIFFGTLNDFLPEPKKNIPIKYNLKERPAIKDAIEALGIPHPEVNVILVNKRSVNFNYLLEEKDEVEVYPVSEKYTWSENHELLIEFQKELKFVLDVHLGKLAKYLRLLGFDTSYENNYSDKIIAQLAEAENRIVLTRDVGLLKLKVIKHGYWLRSQHLEQQLAEVTGYFNLSNKFAPFTRCTECNGQIVEVTKGSVLEQLPPKTRLYFDQFYQCRQCGKVYWKGSHFEHMLQTVSKLIQPEK